MLVKLACASLVNLQNFICQSSFPYLMRYIDNCLFVTSFQFFFSFLLLCAKRVVVERILYQIMCTERFGLYLKETSHAVTCKMSNHFIFLRTLFPEDGDVISHLMIQHEAGWRSY